MTKDLLPKDEQMQEISILFPATEDQSSLLVGCRRTDYSASLIARAIEDCDAQVLNLNVTALPTEPDSVIVALRINHRSPEAATRSLARYGYDVVSVIAGSDAENDSMRMRANELLHYINM